jgi:mono/diheme cytochrome c family protein
MRKTVRLAAVALATGLSSTAWALPWNIDMADSASVKAYEQAMAVLPDGVMSQPNLLTPISYRRNWALTSPDVNGLTAEAVLGEAFDLKDPAHVAKGAVMYNTYCVPCHGDGVNLGPVGAPGRYPAVAVLAGDTGRLSKVSDGWVYLTVRNGSLSTLMPGYSFAMDDREIWALISFLRSETVLKGTTYVPPETAPAATTGGTP